MNIQSRPHNPPSRPFQGNAQLFPALAAEMALVAAVPTSGGDAVEIPSGHLKPYENRGKMMVLVDFIGWLPSAYVKIAVDNHHFFMGKSTISLVSLHTYVTN